MEKFRKEYEKLHRALKTSHENEKRLIKKCRELNNEIVENASKIQTALKLTQEDTNTINLLKSEIEKTYKMLEISREREEKNKQRIENLQIEISQLRNIIDQGNSISTGQNNTVNELMAAQDVLTKERDSYLAKCEELRKDRDYEAAQAKRWKEDRDNFEQEIRTLKKNLQETEERVQKDEDRKKKIQGDFTFLIRFSLE